MKQINTCASMRRRIKWNMVRISILDFAMRNARSSCHRLWYAEYTCLTGTAVLMR